jgi:hypothetical protein
MKEVFGSRDFPRSIIVAGNDFSQAGDEKYSASFSTLNVADMIIT